LWRLAALKNRLNHPLSRKAVSNTPTELKRRVGFHRLQTHSDYGPRDVLESSEMVRP